MTEARKRHPYAHLSDPELDALVREAVDMRLRMAELEPDRVRVCLIENGCPRSSAVRMVTDPLMRPMAARFYLDAQDAALGDREAKARVEEVKGRWAQLRERGAPETPEEARREAELDAQLGR